MILYWLRMLVTTAILTAWTGAGLGVMWLAFRKIAGRPSGDASEQQ